MPCTTHDHLFDSSWTWSFLTVTTSRLEGKKNKKIHHLWIRRGAKLTSSLLWGLFRVCVFISCPRTPTVPICSLALLSSSTAASCVVTALCFILSPAVTLCSPGISISCSLVSSSHHHHQHPQPSSCLPMSAGESWAEECKGNQLSPNEMLLPASTLRMLEVGKLNTLSQCKQIFALRCYLATKVQWHVGCRRQSSQFP